MRLLSANQRSAIAPVASVVSRTASPPSGAMRYTCGSLSSFRLAAKAIHLPSGDHCGSESLSPAVNRRDLLPSIGKSHSSVLPSFFSML